MAAKIDLSQVGYFIEVNQLGLGVNGSMWAHTDPISQEDKGVRKEVLFSYFHYCQTCPFCTRSEGPILTKTLTKTDFDKSSCF